MSEEISDFGNRKPESGEVPQSSIESWFFSDAAAVQRLRTAAGELAGTPFRMYGRAPGPGGGMDCVALCEALMLASGAVDQFTFPRTPEDYSRHIHNNKILNYLRGKADDLQSATLVRLLAELPKPEKIHDSAFRYHFEFRQDSQDFQDSENRRSSGSSPNPSNPVNPVRTLLPGDLLIMKTGLAQWHMPVMLTEQSFIQCAAPDGVSTADLGPANYLDHLVAVFRARKFESGTQENRK